jgi:hypothetical protein
VWREWCRRAEEVSPSRPFDFDVGTQFAYVVGKDLEAFGQSFVAFREPIKSFIDGHACFHCSVSGIAAPNDGVRGTSRLNTCDLSGHIWVGTR